MANRNCTSGLILGAVVTCILAAGVVQAQTSGGTRNAATGGTGPIISASVSLQAVAAISATDAWAVGTFDPYNATLIEHWDGTNWTQVPSPNPCPHSGTLTGVAAISTTDVWAVGWSICNQHNGYRTLIEHWDGAQWSIVRSANPGTMGDTLSAVSAISGDDIWAVGGYCDANHINVALAEHWDGARWKAVRTARVVGDVSLLGVAAVSSNDVWATGFRPDNTDADTLAQHWDGVQWNTVPTPNAKFAGGLGGVTAVSASEVWTLAGGTYFEEWNGATWSPVYAPNVYGTRLLGITALPTGEVWAVGFRGAPEPFYTLTERWNGSNWEEIASVNPGSLDNTLLAVAGSSSSDVWTVGRYTSDNITNHTLIEHWNGTDWSLVPSP